jgi:hypothetical protein
MSSTPPPTLAEFVLACIAEDESEAARQVQQHGIDVRMRQPLTKTLSADPEHDWCTITAARVLVECQAKRRIVNRAQLVLDSWHHLHEGDPGLATYPDVTERERAHAAEDVYNLAEIYGSYENYERE